MLYLVVYDITDVKRLSKVAKYLENIALRVQNSTFEIDLSLTNIPISKIFDDLVELCLDGDRVYIYPIKKKQDIQIKTDDWDMVL
jgi:CRISPR-associated endonuclease Cas2